MVKHGRHCNLVKNYPKSFKKHALVFWISDPTKFFSEPIFCERIRLKRKLCTNVNPLSGFGETAMSE